jgi:endogenous inhibitor of DNA gyrase (YacG/DUF329 family)
MTDLGKWLGEEYRVMGGNASDEREDELPVLEDQGESPKPH